MRHCFGHYRRKHSIAYWGASAQENWQKTEGAHFLKGFEGENVRKNKEKTATATEHREIEGLTFLVLNFGQGF